MALFSKFFSKDKDKETSSSSSLEEVKKKKVVMYYNAGVAYYKKNDLLNSKKYFEKVISLDPENKNARHNLKVVLRKLRQEIEKREIRKAPKEKKRDTTTTKEKRKAPAKKDKNYYYKMLKLEVGATKEEVRTKINQEFKKWRTRINSPDIKKRFEAEEMLAIISQAKRKILD